MNSIPAFAKIIAMVFFIALSFGARASGDFKTDFEEANRQYDQGKYAEAKKLYNSIVQDGHYSPELFYNLGNTEFRLDKTGPAILNYERALALSPTNPEAQANLVYARGQTGAKIAEKDWRDSAVANLDVNVYCWIAAVAGWAGIFILAALFLKIRIHTAPLWLAGLCSAAIFGYSIFAIFHLEKNDSLAIVTAKSAEARFAPADNSSLAATLPAGSRVWILERRGPWIYCKLPDNNLAWIAADTVERVRLQRS
jgi:tetratricopeptide (TPR) repeat protein